MSRRLSTTPIPCFLTTLPSLVSKSPFPGLTIREGRLAADPDVVRCCAGDGACETGDSIRICSLRSRIKELQDFWDTCVALPEIGVDLTHAMAPLNGRLRAYFHRQASGQRGLALVASAPIIGLPAAIVAAAWTTGTHIFAIPYHLDAGVALKRAESFLLKLSAAVHVRGQSVRPLIFVPQMQCLWQETAQSRFAALVAFSYQSGVPLLIEVIQAGSPENKRPVARAATDMRREFSRKIEEVRARPFTSWLRPGTRSRLSGVADIVQWPGPPVPPQYPEITK